jgi:hypothetical protein
MKKIIFAIFLVSTLVAHEQSEEANPVAYAQPMPNIEIVEARPVIEAPVCQEQSKKVDKTQEYKNKKAHEAIIHDTYQEAMKLEDVPQSYINLVKQFDLNPQEVTFYTAVRMNRFVEKVGNTIMLLHPNFFLYLTEQEQLAYIGIQLARIKAGDNSELGGKHDPAKRVVKQVRDGSLAVIGAFIAGMYYKEIIAAGQEWWPSIKNAALSKPGMIIGALLILNGLVKGHYQQNKIKRYLQHELDSIDVMGADGLISAREKQVNWGKNNASWLQYQWGKFKGNLFLDMNPEVELGRIMEHVARKNEAVNVV